MSLVLGVGAYCVVKLHYNHLTRLLVSKSVDILQHNELETV